MTRRPAEHPPELRDLVQALGDLMRWVQVLAPTGNAGIMLRARRDTPRPALESIYATCDRFVSTTGGAKRKATAAKPRRKGTRKGRTNAAPPPPRDPGGDRAA